MSLTTRTIRGIKPYLLSVPFRYKLWREGVSDEWVRESYRFLLELDSEPHETFHDIEVFGCGSHVYLKRSDYRITVNEDEFGRIYVHKWEDKTLPVTVEGESFPTHWREIYRTNKSCDSLSFVGILGAACTAVDAYRHRAASKIRTMKLPLDEGGEFVVTKVRLPDETPGFVVENCNGDLIEMTFRQGFNLVGCA